MTWLPISVKNAAKCDKWYVLQNHSITESLNAKGAREKPFLGHPRACRISQCRKNKNSKSTSFSNLVAEWRFLEVVTSQAAAWDGNSGLFGVFPLKRERYESAQRKQFYGSKTHVCVQRRTKKTQINASFLIILLLRLHVFAKPSILHPETMDCKKRTTKPHVFQ